MATTVEDVTVVEEDLGTSPSSKPLPPPPLTRKVLSPTGRETNDSKNINRTPTLRAFRGIWQAKVVRKKFKKSPGLFSFFHYFRNLCIIIHQSYRREYLYLILLQKEREQLMVVKLLSSRQAHHPNHLQSFKLISVILYVSFCV